MEKRTEQYNGVREALTEMKRINDKTPLPEIFLKIYLIEEKILLYDEVKMVTQTFFVLLENIRTCQNVWKHVDYPWADTKLCHGCIPIKDETVL